jgi:hypothetical protein
MPLPLDYDVTTDDADQDADQKVAALLLSLFAPTSLEITLS